MGRRCGVGVEGNIYFKGEWEMRCPDIQGDDGKWGKVSDGAVRCRACTGEVLNILPGKRKP